MVHFSKCFSINRIDDPMGTRSGLISNYPARRAWVYSFSPSSALWNACPVEFPPLGGTPYEGFHRAGLFLRGQRKGIRKNSLCDLLALLNCRWHLRSGCERLSSYLDNLLYSTRYLTGWTSSEAGGAGLEGHAICFVRPLVSIVNLSLWWEHDCRNS